MNDARRILGNLASVPTYNTTTDKATAKSLSESVFCNLEGDLRRIRVKSLGLDVYKVWSEPFFDKRT